MNVRVRATYVCRACYRPKPQKIKPWQAYVCVCYEVDPYSKKGKALARAEKERRKAERQERLERRMGL